MTRTLRLAIVAGILMLTVLALFSVRACTDARKHAAEAKLEKANSEAIVTTAEAISEKAAEVEQAAIELDKATKELTDAIEQAPAGDSNDAADLAVCGMRSYRDSERCAALRKAYPPVASPAGPAR